MQRVVRFAKRGSEDREVLRDLVIVAKSLSDTIDCAVSELRPGERIVMIAEAGYH